MFCQKCGKEYTDGAAFCTGCGADLLNPNQNNADPKDDQSLMRRSGELTYIVGFVGCIFLIIGCFTPLVSVPLFGSINYFRNGTGDGVLILRVNYQFNT